MTEGWLNDDYLVFFSDAECVSLSADYGVTSYLPGYSVVGLRGWDDLIVRDQEGQWHTIPTVPLDVQLLRPYMLATSRVLQADDRFKGRIKWYVKPLVFGGSATEKANITWINLKQHTQLVYWWNDQYRSAKGK